METAKPRRYQNEERFVPTAVQSVELARVLHFSRDLPAQDLSSNELACCKGASDLPAYNSRRIENRPNQPLGLTSLDNLLPPSNCKPPDDSSKFGVKRPVAGVWGRSVWSQAHFIVTAVYKRSTSSFPLEALSRKFPLHYFSHSRK